MWGATDHSHSGGWGSKHAERGNRGVDIGLQEEETRGGRKKKYWEGREFLGGGGRPGS